MEVKSRNENSARNVFYMMIKQLFLLFLNFLTKTIFIKTLGEEYLGLNGLFYNIFLLFTYMEAGIGTAMIFYFYKPFAKHDKQQCAALYQYFKKIYYVLSVSILFLGVLIIPFLHYLIDIDMPLKKVIWYYLLYIFSSFLNNFFIYQTYVLVSDQKQYIVSKIQLILESLCFLAQILILIFFHSFEWYLICVIIKFILIGVLTSCEVRSRYTYLRKLSGKLEKGAEKNIEKDMKTLFIYKLSKALIHGTDNIIISLLVGTVYIGYYSNYDFIIIGVFGFVTSFYSAISASVGNLIVEKKEKSQYQIYQVIEMINFWISGFTSTCLIVLFQDFIDLWIGKKYQLSLPIIIVIVFNYYLRCLRESTSMFREAAGMFRKFKNITLITAILNIGLSLLLGWKFGLIGILGATGISILLTYFWYEPYLVFQELFKKPLIPYFKGQCKNFLITLTVVFITYGTASLLPAVTIFSFIGKILLCILIPNISYFLIYRKTFEFQTFFQMAKGLIRRKSEEK